MSGDVIAQCISWHVIHGKKLGKILWIPTANIPLYDQTIKDGVYACNIVLSQKIYIWVGTYLQDKNIFEVHIFDFSQDIYGRYIEIILLEKIRNNKKFTHIEDLKKQIQIDIQKSKNINFTTLTFWCFDILHKWHIYYLYEAKKYTRNLVTIVARDTTIKSIKWKKPYHSQNIRKKQLQKLWYSDVIHIWDAFDPFVWLQLYAPKIIALGYDQRGKYVDELYEKLVQYNLTKTKIIRIKSLKPDIYKSSVLRENIENSYNSNGNSLWI